MLIKYRCLWVLRREEKYNMRMMIMALIALVAPASLAGARQRRMPTGGCVERRRRASGGKTGRRADDGGWEQEDERKAGETGKRGRTKKSGEKKRRKNAHRDQRRPSPDGLNRRRGQQREDGCGEPFQNGWEEEDGGYVGESGYSLLTITPTPVQASAQYGNVSSQLCSPPMRSMAPAPAASCTRPRHLPESPWPPPHRPPCPHHAPSPRPTTLGSLRSASDRCISARSAWMFPRRNARLLSPLYHALPSMAAIYVIYTSSTWLQRFGFHLPYPPSSAALLPICPCGIPQR